MSILWYCGMLKLLTLIMRLVQLLKRQSRSTAHLTERYGRESWAVITGGSDGIGLEMAKELSRRHFNIVIIARNPEKLKVASASITKTNIKTQVKTIEFDFSRTIAIEDYQRLIVDQIQDLDVSLLVNNVGTMLPGDFEQVSLVKHKEMIDVGIVPSTLLTKLLMAKMLGRPRRTGVMFVTSA